MGFFRNPKALSLLEKQLIPTLVQQLTPGETLKFWVPTCATGEEAYWLAILASESLRERRLKAGIEVFATDSDPAALDFAQAGIFAEASSLLVPPRLLQRYFKRTPRGHEVLPDLRSLCRFSELGRNESPRLSEIDLITWRKEGIYDVTPPQTESILLFYDALRPGGYLLLGSAKDTELRLVQKTQITGRSPSQDRDLGHKLIQVEEELRDTRAELRSALEQVDSTRSNLQNPLLNTELPILFLDRNLRIQRYTPAAAETFKLISSDIGQEITNIPSTLVLPGLRESVDQVLANPQTIETEVASLDGRRFFLMRCSPYHTANHVVDGVVISFADVTALKNAEAEIRDNEARLRSLFLQAPAPVAILRGPDLVFELANPAFHELWGKASLDGKKLREAAPEFEEKSFQILETVFRTGTAFVGNEFQATLNRGDGAEVCYFNFLAQALRNQDGAIEGVMIFAYEVSDQVIAMQKLRTASGQLLLERNQANLGAEIGKILTGIEPIRTKLQRCAESVVGNLNASFVRIWTLSSAEEVLEMQASAGRYTHLNGPHGRVPVGKFKIGLIAQSRRPHLTNEVQDDPLVNQDWARREGVVAFAGYPLLVGERLVGVLGMFSQAELAPSTLQVLGSISDELALGIDQAAAELERSKLLIELQNAVKVRDEFMSIASHELKTPLTSLMLQIQFRRRRLAKGDASALLLEQLPKLINDDEKQVLRILRLIDDMLDVSRISLGKLSLHREPFDLTELVRDAIERVGPQVLATSGSPIVLDQPSSVPGTWDRFRVEQVLTNLLTNAARYGSGKPIEVRVALTGPRAILTVSDHGIGIAPANFQRIFNRFERAISENEISGLGLGLYIAQQIVEAHGGTIRVESELGSGSLFTVELPT